jgi:hypothetical protein
VKSAFTMSSSSRVVIGDLKWQYTYKHTVNILSDNSDYTKGLDW